MVVVDLAARIALPRPVADSKQRQKNALDIIKFICDHSLSNAYIYELLSTRFAFLE
jgi:hypothetical protein